MGNLMRAVFDTCILIDYLRGIPAARKEFNLYEQKIISIITFIETLVGARTNQEENAIRALLNTFAVSNLNPSIAERSIKIRKEHHLKVPDAIVYATAKESGCILVTRNTKDFKSEWPDIRIPYLL
ncbi:type II toxin-antitoxin system VapC family toxin [Verrucomicrobia bacterium]|nr:type II toxin-antitoxin system VapC family toxin [Verrucomicrobiota bacterium]